jgi:hypothetical protein
MASNVILHCHNCPNRCPSFAMPVVEIDRLIASQDLKCKAMAINIMFGHVIFGICMARKQLIQMDF